MEIEETKEERVIFYHCHRMRLEQRSKYFETLFGEMEKSGESEIVLNEDNHINESSLRDYFNHVYFVSKEFTPITNQNLLFLLHLSRYFLDDILHADCRPLLSSSSFVLSDAFPDYGHFELLSIGRQYSVEGLKDYCIEKLKELEYINNSINGIKKDPYVWDESLFYSSITDRAKPDELAELLVHYIDKLASIKSIINSALHKKTLSFNNDVYHLLAKLVGIDPKNVNE